MTPRDPAELAARAAGLRAELQQANHDYYVLDRPTLADAGYDQLFRELQEIEAEHPELRTPDSPTLRIGSEPSTRLEKTGHLAPMLSLGNAFNAAELGAWETRNARIAAEVSGGGYIVEPKIDGLAITLTYADGVLVKGATRGNGSIGEEVTPNLRTIRDIPLRLRDAGIPPPPLLEIRGEVFLSLSGFETLNSERAERGESTFANPRNASAGSLRQLDPGVTAGRPLHFFAFDLQLPPAAPPALSVATQSQLLELLESWGLPVNPLRSACEDLGCVVAEIQRIEEQRDSLDYEIDGVVVKVRQRALHSELGIVGGREPRWAVAYKFAPNMGVTRLLDIRINVGRTGSLNPYAVLEPVQIGGTTVKLATLHNEEDIQRKDIRAGDRVLVKRAGDVIPQVTGPVLEGGETRSPPFSMPDRCPACSTSVEQPPGEVMRYCPNGACPARLFWGLVHFVGRNAMDIRGLGERTVQQLLDQQLVQDAGDLYSLTREQLLGLEGFKAKSADNLLAGIVDSRERGLERALFALGVRHVGETAAELLARAFGDIDALISAGVEEMAAVHGIGGTTAQALHGYLAEERNREIIEKLRAAGVDLAAQESAPAEGPLSGYVFVITGTLPALSRKQAAAIIEQAGGRVSGSVTGKTDFLVLGEDAGSKLAKARELGVTLLSEDELLVRAGASPAPPAG